MTDSAPDSVYRLNKAIPAHLLGLAALGCGVTVALRLLGAALDAPGGLLTAVQLTGAALGVAGILVGIFVLRPPTVVRLTPEGFAVRWIRGAGVTAAEWRAIEAVTADDRGVVVLRHRDGGSTYIPLAAVDAPPATIEADIARRLNTSRGYRRIR